MEKTSNATETNASTIAPKEEVKVLTPTEEDLEAKVTALEAEKARLIEEGANYKLAYLKSKKQKEETGDDEDLEERMRRISQETLANSRLSEIAQEQDAIIKKALKENKELKLAQMNKTTVAASTGAHSESTAVTSTILTPEQRSALVARGWDDKKIDRYIKNFQRNSR
jgi:hypothetical protein